MKSLKLRISVLMAGTILVFSIVAHSQTLQDAIKLTNNEEFEKADKAFQSLETAQPTVGDVYFYRGENFYNWGKVDSAQNTYQKGINVNAVEPLNYVGLGKTQLSNGDSKSAMDNFFKAKTISKNKDALVLDKIAEADINVAGKDPNTASDLLNQAVTLLNQAIKIDTKNATYHLDLGDAYLAQNPTDGSKSIEEYNTASSLDPKNVNAMLRLGQLWKNARDYKTSFDYFIKATKIDSTYAPAYREQAEMLYESGRFDEAIAAYTKYLQLNNSLTARIRYGEFLFAAKKYDNAITELQNDLSKDSSNIILYRLLGYSQYEKKDYKNGLTNMDKFFAKSKGTKIKIFGSDYSYLGKLLSKNGQDSLAIISLNQAVKAINNPTSQDVIDIDLLIAQIYSNDQNYAMAEVYFKKRIQAKQQNADVNDYYYLGQAQSDNKQYQAADSSFSFITKNMPDLLLGYQLRARANSQLDSTQTIAKPYWEQYIQKAVADTVKNKTGLIEAYSELGYYYLLKKDKVNASIWYKKILSLDPGNANAKAYFDSLKPRPAPKTEGKK
jgi:tetratricopeptide (TPR) repeat protein